MQHWHIAKTTYKVSDFISWQRAGTLVLSPSFQRRSVWTAGAKSFFVDTVARGLPVPVVFLREVRTNPNTLEPGREVVDGQQRLRTLLAFIDPQLLPDYSEDRDAFVVSRIHNPSIAQKKFSALPSEIRRNILDYQFSVHVLPAETADSEILQIFARMNATGVKLNAQELRNAQYFGAFKTIVYQLSGEQLDRWRQWGIFTEQQITRMAEVEFVSECLQLMLRGVVKKSKAALDNLYKEHELAFPQEKAAETRFRRVMDAIDQSFKGSVPRPLERRPLFYCLFGAMHDILYGGANLLARSSAGTVPASTIEHIYSAAQALHTRTASEKVLEAVSRRTTDPQNRKAIIKYLKP